MISLRASQVSLSPNRNGIEVVVPLGLCTKITQTVTMSVGITSPNS